MMTEQEAKTKWCPMVRASMGTNDLNASNRCAKKGQHGAPMWALCIGSLCACWTWDMSANLTKLVLIRFEDCAVSCELPGDRRPPPLSAAAFKSPGPEWTQDGEPYEDDEGYVLQFKRELDPNRLGHCGLCR